MRTAETDAKKPEGGDSTIGYYLRKLVDETITSLPVQAEYSHGPKFGLIPKYYCNHAEACYHSSGYADKANKDIKDIRNRVGLPYLDKSGRT
ncbi:RagB/SusD family nutrient uptake outer membrane protein [Bacteroides thetaiotaomicron]|nr:RagB/SusD family nutrient uptake outer membrane protein [Bacteroides thetaiotaomicron]